ncbi:neprilysin-like [Chelonus insularis]|uniref:neprilysin-like n=1 Tax=Chelonus insularis TaxID=460826 RepID=UPI0015893A8F|nr:neprilysin-like [Chelonus insularis]
MENKIFIKIILVAVILSNTLAPTYSRKITWENDADYFDIYSWLVDIDGNGVEKNVDNQQVCTTPECQKIAQEFLHSMNKSVDPCDDFYDFTCGNWNQSSKIPGYLPAWSKIHMFQNVVHLRVKGILEEKIESGDILPVRQAKKWYHSCMDEDLLEKRGLQPIETILMRFGGWPMTIDEEMWDEEEFSWQQVEGYYFHLTRSYIFYQFKPRAFSYDDIGILPGELPLIGKLPLKYRNYTGEDYDAYQTLVESVARIFIAENKADVSEEVFQRDVRELVEFEKKLFTIQSDEYFDWKFDTFGDFKKWYHDNITAIIEENGESENNIDYDNKDDSYVIDFDKLMGRMFDMISLTYGDDLNVGVSDKMYFLKLFEVMRKTSKRTIVNYIHWHFVSSMLEYSTKDLKDKLFELMEKEYGITERPPRWLECIQETKIIDAVAFGFMKKYFSKETDKKIQTIVENIRKSMRNIIVTSNVIDEKTRTNMLEKLDIMDFDVGFPDWYKNTSIIIQVYRGLTIGSDYMENVLAYRRFLVKRRMRLLVELEDIWLSDEMMITVNAAYGGGRVQVPPVVFQPPLLAPQLPEFVNYGIIGTVLGHEMGHGYDTREFRYAETDADMERISRDNGIWKKLFDKAKCYADHYNKLYNDSQRNSSEEPSSGFRTLRENLADATGIQSVFHAYKNLMSKNGKGLKLPGFEDFTDEQMFFISFANIMCEASTEKYAELLKRLNSHSIGRIRVIGGVSNMEDFAKTFNCPRGSPMNPEHKCNLWQEKSEQNIKKRLTKVHKHSKLIYN